MKWLFVSILVFLAIDLLIFVLLYNRLVRRRNKVREGWSGIEVQLKRRHDLIPSLVNVVKGYASHERTVLEEVTAERAAAVSASGAVAAKAAEEKLAGGMGRLWALVEGYPDLKADKNYRDLMGELVKTEDELQYARRYYNGATRDLNNAVESFPSNVVASIFKFQKGVFFEVSSEAERMAPRFS
jgi:LemA protein